MNTTIRQETKSSARSKGMSKGDQSRMHILRCSLEIFSKHGYEGASTRTIASAAGVNLGAIQYHFNGKEGLYQAAAEYVAERIAKEIAGGMEQANALLADPDTPREDLMDAYLELLSMFCARIVGRQESSIIARFIFREQMEASEAFETLYTVAMSKIIDVTTRLMSRLRGEEEVSEDCRVRALAILGQVIIFETSRAMVLRNMKWKTVGQQQLAQIQSVIRDHATQLVET